MSRRHRKPARTQAGYAPPTAAPAPAAVDSGAWLPGLIGVLLIVCITFSGVLRNGLLNWDDVIAVTRNPELHRADIVRWAFTTTRLEHYQPIVWLVWAAVVRSVGPTPVAFHAVSLIGHALNAALVYALTYRLVSWGDGATRRTVGAAAAALAFALHPVQVETVAWASALPYVLALAFLLLATLAYLEYATSATTQSRCIWFGASLACYALSLLSRAYAVAFAAILLAFDLWVLRREADVKRLILEKVPFAVAGIGAILLEMQARTLSTLADLGVGQRLEVALAAPFHYAARLLVPLWLSPVYPLPLPGRIDWAQLSAAAFMIVLTAMALVRARRRTGLVFVSITLVLLLAPSIAAPSGLQATADRYLYIAMVPLAIGAASLLARMRLPVRTVRIAGIAIATGAVLLTWRQVSYWHDSVALWSRAAALDARNDIAAYNLASALAESGRDDEAVSWYERTLMLVPDHAQARSGLNALLIPKYETEADRHAAAGRFAEAIKAYDKVLGLDPGRRHAIAARGVALARMGAWEAAARDLGTARRSGTTDVEVANSLALSLLRLHREAEAATVLREALAAAPNDVTLAHNLARLLLESADPSVRDAALAESLALKVCASTGQRDPVALETLAGAYIVRRKYELARQVAARGIAAARQSGDADTERALEEMLRRLPS